MVFFCTVPKLQKCNILFTSMNGKSLGNHCQLILIRGLIKRGTYSILFVREEELIREGARACMVFSHCIADISVML